MGYETEAEAIAAAKAVMLFYTNFDGDGECDDDCPGWDGESHRAIALTGACSGISTETKTA